MTPIEELTIEVGGGRVRISSSGGAYQEEPFTPSELDRRIVNIFEDWLRKGKITEDEELEVLGNILYRIIFKGAVKNFFEERLKDLEQKRKTKALQGARLPIALVFRDDASDWARLPWEFLYYPEDNAHLATKGTLVFLRRTPSATDREQLVPPKDLKVLIVVVQPEEFMEGIDPDDRLKYQQGFDALVKQVESLKEKKIDVNVLLDPAPDDLAAALKSEPHVVHYIGYGKYESDGEIALWNPDLNKLDWYSKAKFTDCFEIEGAPPQFVFLQMCQGPQKDTYDYYLKANFAELAPEIIRKNIPAVVAMRYPVLPEVALRFTQKFYETLAEGRSVATAVQVARWYSVLGKKNRDIGSPVLFMHSNDGLILSLPDVEDEKTQKSLTTSTLGSSPAISQSSQSMSEATLPELFFEELAEAGFAQARAVSLKTAEVSREIEKLRKFERDAEGLNKAILDRIQNLSQTDPSSTWVSVFTAMSKTLKSQQSELAEVK